MNLTSRTIEIDADTAAIVDRRSAEQGLSASEFIAALVSYDDGLIANRDEDIAELDRRWAAIEQGASTVGDADVCRWLETWGTPDFKPWPTTR